MSTTTNLLSTLERFIPHVLLAILVIGWVQFMTRFPNNLYEHPVQYVDGTQTQQHQQQQHQQHLAALVEEWEQDLAALVEERDNDGDIEDNVETRR
jgi:hypothetical protein